MKILIYDINYAPELTGVGKYTGEMGAWLVGQGHTVEVITAMPYYPEWAVHEGYRNRLWFTETIAGAVVHRCPFYVPRQNSALKRILHEFSFVLSSVPYWLSQLTKPPVDLVICVAPPFHVGLLPVLYARLRSVPLWLHVQDLQIDMAKELGMLRNERFLRLLFSIERYILRRSTVVSSISEAMLRKISRKTDADLSYQPFPNWVDGEQVRPVPITQSLRGAFGIAPDQRVVLYSGSLGEKQGLEQIIDAAHRLRHRPDLLFLIVGAGGGKARLEQMAHAHNLTNVRFFPLQPPDKLAALLCSADLHLVLQKKSASDLVLPSKLTNILAVGGCAIVSALPGTTLYDTIDRHGMGVLIEPESTDALVAGIERTLASDRSGIRANALRYAGEHLDKNSILTRFHHQLLACAQPADAALLNVA